MFFLIQFFTYFLIVLSVDPPYGKLSVSGKGQLLGNNGQVVQLRGLSLFFSQWNTGFFDAGVVRAIKCFYNGNIVRAPIGTVDGGYMDNPDKALKAAYTVIDAAISNGIYVLVDWHDSSTWSCNKTSDVQRFTNKAKEFFTIIAKKYKGVSNVLLEFWNEPACEWNIVKKYHTQILKTVREIDQDVIVILGSNDIAKNIFDPVKGKNIMYTLHWYPMVNEYVWYTYPKGIIENATALNRGLFISEYGETDVYPFAAPINYDAMHKFWDLMNQHKLSYMKWTFANFTDPKTPNLGLSLMLNTCNAKQVYQESCLSGSAKFLRTHMWQFNNGLKGC